MNRVAFIRPDGLINHSFLPDRQDDYVAGEVVDGFTIQFFPYTEDPANWLNTKFWDITTGTWQNLPTNPNPRYYVWDGNHKNYILNRSSFEDDIRKQRNKKLLDTDWCVLPDAPVSDTYVQAIKTYRQELRDFPSNIDFDTIEDVLNIVWPVKPEE